MKSIRKNDIFLSVILPKSLLSIIILSSHILSKQPQESLKNAYKDAFLIGTALNRNQILGKDSGAIELTKKQFNAITAENDMKWENIHPKPNAFNFAVADSFVDFGLKNNMSVFGHCLVWHSQTPDWVFQNTEGKATSRDTLLKRMHNHITTIVGRYKGRVKGWDVVNEAITDDGKLRESKWKKIIGNDFIEKAFEFAHDADPEAELYYNDYSLVNKAKRDAVIKLVKSLKKKGVTITAVGEQGHYGLDYPKPEALDVTINELAKLDVKVIITEMDVTVIPFPSNSGSADISLNVEFKKKYDPYSAGLPDSINVKLADKYSELFNVLLKHRRVISRVSFWGVNDAQSWRNYWPIKGRSDYPLIFDRKNKPKKAFNALLKCAESE